MRAFGLGMLCALVLGVCAAPAPAKVVDIPARIVIESDAQPTPSDPGRCVSVAVLRFAEHARATTYTAVVHNAALQADQTFNGPPFDDEAQYGGVVVTAPSGSHQFILSANSTGAGCEQGRGALEAKHRFVSMTAAIDGPPKIKGRVVDEDGVPIVDRVKITARGPRRLSTATGPDGRYEIEVPEGAVGRYTVTPGARDIEFEPSRRTVTVRRGQSATANFRASLGCGARASRVLQPRQGFYFDRARPRLQLIYSCRTRVAVASFNMTDFDWEGCDAELVWRAPEIYGLRRVYSKRMPVSDAGRFSSLTFWRGSEELHKFKGAFDSRQDAHVEFTFPDCLVNGDADHMIWLGDVKGIRF